MSGNIFENIPRQTGAEIFQQLLHTDNLSIERIISRGNITESGQWYEQHRAEWVMLLQGAAILYFEDGESHHLLAGDYLNIAAGRRHRVNWTDPECETIWLAVHYS